MHMNGSSHQVMHSRFSVLVSGLFLLGLLEAKACVVAKLVACLALNFFSWALEPFKMSGISTLATPIFVLWANLGSKLFLYWFGGLCSTFLCCTCFSLTEDFFFLCLPFDNSVHWWCIRLIWAAWGSPATYFMCLAVALELSIFLASWHTLLAGNLPRFTLPSFIVLETNFSSFSNNQKISLCSILADSGGYLARLICAWSTLYHSSMLLVPCLKLVNKSKWALTSFAWGLQNSSKHSQIVSKLRSALDRLQDTCWPIPNSPL